MILRIDVIIESTKCIIACQLPCGVTKCYNLHKHTVTKSHIHNMQECPLYTLPLPMDSFSKATIKCALPTNTMTHSYGP